jgi:hypothetical protein
MSDDLDLSKLGRNPSSVTLKDATREEICDELERRFAAIVVLTAESSGDDDDHMSCRYSGGFYAALGMVTSFADSHLWGQRERND